MKKKAFFLTIIFLLINISLFAFSFFPSYDFTYFETVSESILIPNRIGFDYTGFGFLKNYNFNGLFVRLGLLMPKESFISLIPSSVGNGYTIIFTEPDPNKPDIKEIRFNALIGPALRHEINNTFLAYFGLGLKLQEVITINNVNHPITTYNSIFSFDFDAGFSSNLNKNTTCRFGIYGSYEILSFEFINEKKPDEDSYGYTTNVHMNFLASKELRKYLEPVMYISLGKVFTNVDNTKTYMYEITTNEKFTGKLSEI